MRYSLGLFALALAIRLVTLAATTREDLFAKYTAAAEMLRDGRLSGSRVLDFSPLYLELHRLALATGMAAAEALVALQCVAGAATCVLVFRIAAALVGRAGAIAAGVIAAFAGDLVLADQILEPDSLLLLSGTAVVWLAMAHGPRAWPRFAACGALLGVAVALRPASWVLLGVVALALAAAFRGGARREALASAAAFAVVLGCAQGALVMRNRSHGPDASMSPWQVLYLGNNPGSMGSLSYGFAVSDLAEQLFARGVGPDPAHEAFRRIALAGGAPAGAPDRYWRDLAVTFAVEHPRAFLALLGKKVLALGQPYALHDTFDARHLGEELAGWPLLPVSLVLPFALAGFVVGGRRLLHVAVAAGLQLSVCIVFYASARYRLPLVPWLCVAAGALVAWAAGAWRRASWRGVIHPSAVAPAAVAVLAAAAFRLPLLPGAFLARSRSIEVEAERGRRAAVIAARAGDVEHAVRALSRSLLASPWSLERQRLPGIPFPLERMAEDVLGDAQSAAAASPRDPWGWLRLGSLARLAGQDDVALDALRRADGASSRPDELPIRVTALVQRGLVSLASGRTEEAHADFRRAAALEPGLLAPLVGLAESSPPPERERILEVAARVSSRVAVLYSDGRLLLELGRPDDALVPLSQLTAALPGYARGQLLHAVALVRSGRLDEAAGHAAIARDLHPSLLDGRYSALEVWEAVSARPGMDDASAWLVLAEQAELHGAPEAAARARRHVRRDAVR